MPGTELLLVSSGGLLAGGLCPESWLRLLGLRRSTWANMAVSLLLTAGLIELAMHASHLVTGGLQTGEVTGRLGLAGLYVDGTAALALVLVSFVGGVIGTYSIRYMDGEHNNDRYWRWLCVTILGASVVSVSGNLSMMLLAWSLCSIGIHQLLTLYPDRPVARRAAWTRFWIDRLGDIFLIGACVLLHREFGTLELTELFASAAAFAGTPPPASSLPLAGALLITGAAIKTVQMPFHTWLPETLDAPTPVSALMHAGIVNAGGYFLIRISPLLAWSPTALTILSCIGAFTACVAATVMLTQPSVKKSLAWSTIAQMGFMMLQCGLGAFSTAMLHLIAHSLYKAHAFLNSGSVLQEAASTAGATLRVSRSTDSEFRRLCGLAAANIAVFALTAVAWGIDLNAKPGGFLLGLIVCLGMTRWTWLTGLLRNPAAITAVIGAAGGLSTLYFAGVTLLDSIVHNPAIHPANERLNHAVALLAAVGFVGLFILEAWLTLDRLTGWQHSPVWLKRTWVHASHGFYLDALYTRILLPFSTREPRHYAGVSVRMACRMSRKETI